MALTKDEVIDKIKLKKVGGVWGISIPSDFVSAEVEIKISRKDKYSKCNQAIKDSIKFDDNSNDELGIRVGLAGDMDPDHDNEIGLKTVFEDSYGSDGVALVDFDIGNVSTNYNSGDAPSRTETDTLSINKNEKFYKFDTLEGRTDGGNVIDYQRQLKNPPTSNWDGRELPDISSDGQTLDFHDNDGSDNNARMTFTSKDVKFKEKASLSKIEIQKSSGAFGSKSISNDTGTVITRTVQPSSTTGTFYQINLTVDSGDTPNLISSNRDGTDFYESKKAIFIRDNCNGDNDDGTDYKNTLIFIKSIKNIKLTGTPPPVDDPDPVDEPEDPDPVDPPADPIYVDTTVGGPCPTNPDWSNNWPGGYVPTCSPAPATVSDPGGVMSLDRDPGNKRKVSLTFTDIPAGAPGRELRQKLNLPNTASARSMKNKLITIKVTYEKRAGWANNLVMTASCSDIKKPNGTFELSGVPYSKPDAEEAYGENAANVSGREWYFYNIDGSSTVDFVFSSTPESAPTRTRYTGQTETVSTSSDGGDPPTITTTTTITCVPPGGIPETYSPWPPCPEEVYVTRTGGTTASAVYSDGHHDGANDQFIDIELIAIRETATGLDGNGIGVIDELKKFVWITSSTADNDNNLGSVDGRSLIDYDEHDKKIRFRNPTTQTSAEDLATNGTGIIELKDHSGAHLPGTIDTKVAAASSLPINLSY